MKKSLIAASLALATALALTGCSGHTSPAATSPAVTTPAAPPATTWTQVHDLASAIAWALQISPSTPNVTVEITKTAGLLQKYIDASDAYTDANRATLDAQLAQLKSDIAAGKATDYIGGELQAVAQNALQFLNKK